MRKKRKDMRFVSKNPSVAAVVDNKKVRGVSAGKTMIEAYDDNDIYRGQAEVNVTAAGSAIEPTGITLNAGSLSITYRMGGKLTATVSPVNATNKTVIWESSDTDIATVVDGNVTVTQEKSGWVTITAYTYNREYYASCRVNVTEEGTRIDSVFPQDLYVGYAESSNPITINYTNLGGVESNIYATASLRIGNVRLERVNNSFNLIIPENFGNDREFTVSIVGLGINVKTITVHQEAGESVYALNNGANPDWSDPDINDPDKYKFWCHADGTFYWVKDSSYHFPTQNIRVKCALGNISAVLSKTVFPSWVRLVSYELSDLGPKYNRTHIEEYEQHGTINGVVPTDWIAEYDVVIKCDANTGSARKGYVEFPGAGVAIQQAAAE